MKNELKNLDSDLKPWFLTVIKFTLLIVTLFVQCNKGMLSKNKYYNIKLYQ